eukprot:TRINITY_DN3182_c1_g1_i1.p1 TRINITY_DN3182_c1_g1~~TRINITY_DN3182_c1_g1_i1.p1  ORF type:complete len:164 (+),score=24.25 TRINITY_DN3182_c1_g1_i1:276-767(+)
MSVTKITDLRPQMADLTVEVSVVEAHLISESGKRQVAECLVGDDSGCILLKARGKDVDELSSGRQVRISKCKVDMYRGSMRLACDPETAFEDASVPTVKKAVNMSLLEFEAVLVAQNRQEGQSTAPEAQAENAATMNGADYPQLAPQMAAQHTSCLGQHCSHL